MPESPKPPVPAYTLAQVEYIESICPDRAPDKGMTNREIWMASGRASLARHLRGLYEKQLQKTLEGAPIR